MTESSVKNAVQPAIREVGVTAPAPSAATKALRMRETTSAIVPYLSYGAKRLGHLGVLGISLCVFSLIAFVSGNLALRQQVGDQAAELVAARQTVADSALNGPDLTPAVHAGQFVESLPGRSDVPQIMGSVVTVAAASGIELSRGNYEYVESDDGAIARYRMTLPVSGSYPQVRQFIENLLATVPAIALDNMRIERDNVSDQVIAADLRFTVLLEGEL